MQDQLEKLRKIGVKEIAKVTKISISKLEDILEKRFENIQRVRAEGFLNILEREYKVDLSEWLKEYDELSKQSRLRGLGEESQKFLDNLDLDTQKQKDDLKIKRQKRSISKKQFYFCIVIAVILLLGYFGYKSFLSMLVPQQSLSKDKRNDLAVLEAKTMNENQKSLEPSQENNLQENFELKANSPTFEGLKNLPLEQESILEKLKPQNDVKNQTPILLPIQSSSSEQSLQKTQIFFKPEKKIWIEVQNLSTNKKDSKIVEIPFTIEASKDDLLISLGHGEVSVVIGDKVTQYNSASPLRFLYSSKKGLERIRYSQYLKLSGSDESDKVSD